MRRSALNIIDAATMEAARSDRELWTHKSVRRALVQAFLRDRTEGRVGPRGDKAFWVSYVRDYADHDRQHHRYERWMTLDRMNQVLGGWEAHDGRHQPWLEGPLASYPALRRVLHTWIRAEIAGDSFKEVCVREGWVYTTAVTHRDRAAGMIAQRLNAAGVDVWH